MTSDKKLPAFMSSPQRDECEGRLLSAALALERGGYMNRHISLAAIAVAFQYARQQEASEYRFNLEFIENLARSSIEQLNEITADWQARGCPAEG